jgi:hypothetical protein
MDIGDIDPEDFQQQWRRARREWDQMYKMGVVVVVGGDDEEDDDLA